MARDISIETCEDIYTNRERRSDMVRYRDGERERERERERACERVGESERE